MINNMMNVILVAGFPRRRESIAKIHSMTIEAPITKVRQEVYAQEKCQCLIHCTRILKVLQIVQHFCYVWP